VTARAPGAATCATQLDAAARTLREASILGAAREAATLLAHVTGLAPLELALDRSSPIDATAAERFQSLVARRASRVPLQHLVGRLGFHEIELDVGPEALIPRPETELLVEAVLDWARSHQHRSPRVLDLGTGTAAIAAAIAAALPESKVVAVDSSQAALALAARNVRKLGLLDRVSLVAGHWLDPLAAAARFDVLVANPPYLRSDEIGACEPEVRDHDPRAALDGGLDGLDAYRAICAALGSLATRPSLVAFEVAALRPDPVVALLLDAGFPRARVSMDLDRHPRLVLAEG